MSVGGGKSDTSVKDTPEQRALAQVAAEKWNYAQQNLAPLEDSYMDAVGEMTSDSKMGYIRGQANQGQMQALSETTAQADRALTQGGIDPSSGRYGAAVSGLSLDAAHAGGETAGRGQFSQESEQLTGLSNILAMGQGQSTQAQAGLSGVASQAAADARSDAATSYNRGSANLQLLGTAAGMAGSSYLPSAGQGLAMGGTAQPDYAPGQGLKLY
ncbi:hypothetical protein [Salinicola sp. DM10]|uniref:hypothetical protein n=1 Tax=Salinicola sp. DM10 TaxID=2815721 RepID=UPI001A90A947|nr:hypothetical protein [Salinicola sp. DM10]MCE3025718.1 hypothetical protein [Salinicola sp. DM10]